MSCTDPIADLLTSIRNGLLVGKAQVTVPHSATKTGICQVLKDEGYISKFEVLDTKPGRTLRVGLKYGERGEPVIHDLVRVSTPGRRAYAGSKELKPIIRGFGISIVSTSQGILSDRICRQRQIGGEILCVVK